MVVELPCVVWVDLAPGSLYGPDPCFGLLIERRQVHDNRGNPRWEGFVLTGKPPTDTHGTTIKAEWFPFSTLTLVDAPRPPKRGAPKLRGALPQ